MFGFSMKERLYKTIIYFSKSYLDEYVDAISDLIKAAESIEPKVLDKELKKAKMEYLGKVFDATKGYIMDKMPQFGGRIEQIIKSPDEVGLSKEDLKENLSPGKMLIVFLYAIKKKLPKAKECSALDFIYHDVVKEKLLILDQEIKAKNNEKEIQKEEFK